MEEKTILKRFMCSKCVSVEIILAAGLFIYGMAMESLVKAVVDGLYFLILLEITRTAVDYVKKPEQRLKIRYLIDAVIIADLRELTLIIVDSHSIEGKLGIFALYFAALLFLFFIRYISMKISPDEYEQEYKQASQTKEQQTINE